MNRTHQTNMNNSSSNFRLLLQEARHQITSKLDCWHILHSKAMQTAGRGGKGHLGSPGAHGWNRKGRW